MTRLFTLSTLLLLSLPGLFAQPYNRTYVATTGVDNATCGRRTAPCATFQQATVNTTVGGEIDALDSGEFGTFFIEQPVTIDGGPGIASASTFSGVGCAGTITAAICIDGFGSGAVVLRNLSINLAPYSTVYSGIVINGRQPVSLENVQVTGALGYCVFATDVSLVIKNSNFRNCGTSAIYSSGLHPVTVDNVVITDSMIGVNINPSTGLLYLPGTFASLAIRNSDIQNNFIGISVISGAVPAVLTVDSTLVYKNTTGISATAGGVAQISNVTITGNATGLATASGGTIVSFVNNRINNNTTNGAPTSSVYMK